MGILDVVFLVILLIAFISGMQKGLITSFLACVAMVGAFLIAKALEGSLAASFIESDFSSWLKTNFETEGLNWENWYHTLSFVVVFVLAYAALMLIVNLINNVVRMPKIKVVDGLLGGVLGLVRGYAVICITVAALQVLFKPLEVEGNDFMAKMLDGSALGRFFTNSSLGDIFGIGKMITKL